MFTGQVLAADMPPMPGTDNSETLQTTPSTEDHTAIEDSHSAAHAGTDHSAPVHGESGGHGGTGEHHGSGGLPQLDPSTFQTQLFWLVVFFAALYMVFSKKNLPEIGAVVENRRTRIQNDLDAAEKMKAESDAIKQTYEDGMAKAQAQASKFYQDTENAIREKSDREIKAFQEKSQAQLEKSETAISAARVRALTEVEDMSSELGRKAAEKIIGVKLDAAKAA